MSNESQRDILLTLPTLLAAYYLIIYATETSHVPFYYMSNKIRSYTYYILNLNYLPIVDVKLLYFLVIVVALLALVALY